MPLDVARDYLVENQGRQFDPACVEAFLSRWDDVVGIAGGQAATALAKSGTPTPFILGAAWSRPDLDRTDEVAAAV